MPGERSRRCGECREPDPGHQPARQEEPGADEHARAESAVQGSRALGDFLRQVGQYRQRGDDDQAGDSGDAVAHGTGDSGLSLGYGAEHNGGDRWSDQRDPDPDEHDDREQREDHGQRNVDEEHPAPAGEVDQRVLRFQQMLAIARRRSSRDLRQLAVDAGYADQAHMTMECTQLAGLSPGRLIAERYLL